MLCQTYSIQSLTSKVADPVCMGVAGKDHRIADLVLVQMVQDPCAVRAVPIPSIQVNCRVHQSEVCFKSRDIELTRPALVQLGKDNLLTGGR